MKQFKVRVRGDKQGVDLEIMKVEQGRVDKVLIDLTPDQFEEVTTVMVRERLRRKEKKE